MPLTTYPNMGTPIRGYFLKNPLKIPIYLPSCHKEDGVRARIRNSSWLLNMFWSHISRDREGSRRKSAKERCGNR